jgi:hypothetical protein
MREVVALAVVALVSAVVGVCVFRIHPDGVGEIGDGLVVVALDQGAG